MRRDTESDTTSPLPEGARAGLPLLGQRNTLARVVEETRN